RLNAIGSRLTSQSLKKRRPPNSMRWAQSSLKRPAKLATSSKPRRRKPLKLYGRRKPKRPKSVRTPISTTLVSSHALAKFARNCHDAPALRPRSLLRQPRHAGPRPSRGGRPAHRTWSGRRGTANRNQIAAEASSLTEVIDLGWARFQRDVAALE